MIQRCLIVDCETTDLDPKTDAAIEVGCILYDVVNQSPLIHFATLVDAPQQNKAERINRIASATRKDFYDSSPLKHRIIFGSLIADADVIVAHNAEFDRSFLGGDWDSKPWVCTRNDFQWPRQTREGESLVSQALNHGIGVSSAHRAMTDCLLIAALFDRMPSTEGGYELSLQQMFDRAMRPKANFRALVSYEDREKAKAAGFQWDAPSKTWSRRMAIEDAAALPFKTAVI